MIEAIRRELAARADPAKAPDMQAYMKSETPFLGVQKPGRREVARIVFPAYPLDGFDAWRNAVLKLWREATYREERYLAIALARDGRYRSHRTTAALPLYEELIVTGAWWDFVDEVAVRLVGELDVAPLVREWASDPNMWKRRKAIGWALREFSKVDPDGVERYCATHELSPLSRREALRNLDRIRST